MSEVGEPLDVTLSLLQFLHKAGLCGRVTREKPLTKKCHAASFVRWYDYKIINNGVFKIQKL